MSGWRIEQGPGGPVIVLDESAAEPGAAQEKPILFRASELPGFRRNAERTDPGIPERIREMRALYEVGDGSFTQKCRNFYRQGKFMEDYEDDAPWDTAFRHYFPTYQDLTVRQLRGYFAWRTCARRGDWRPVGTSYAFIYVYELLNGIGVSSCGEALTKLSDFKKGFLDTRIGDPGMRKYLRRWMPELAILHGLDRETVITLLDPERQKKDLALSVLRDPAQAGDEAIFQALAAFGGEQNTTASKAVEKDPVRGMRLFADAWRAASLEGLFSELFGKPKKRIWRPLYNAVCLQQTLRPDTDYSVNPCRSYSLRGGQWYETAYSFLGFDPLRLKEFLHEADRQFRTYLHTGRPLRERESERWAAGYARAAIAEEQKRLAEAARQKITIDFSGLEQIRRDALKTRESLLTEEERLEAEVEPVKEENDQEPLYSTDPEATAPGAPEPSLPLDALELRILKRLIAGEDIVPLLREKHLLPAIAADAINEALFDEIGDSVIDCDGETLSLVEDYREDLEQLLSDA